MVLFSLEMQRRPMPTKIYNNSFLFLYSKSFVTLSEKKTRKTWNIAAVKKLFSSQFVCCSDHWLQWMFCIPSNTFFKKVYCYSEIFLSTMLLLCFERILFLTFSLQWRYNTNTELSLKLLYIILAHFSN